MATLTFDIISAFEKVEMILARPEISKEYATAFTEFTAWTGPYKGRKVEIADYQDYFFSIDRTLQVPDISTSIGPNPTTDYLAIRLNQGLEENLAIDVFDIAKNILTSEYNWRVKTILPNSSLPSTKHSVYGMRNLALNASNKIAYMLRRLHNDNHMEVITHETKMADFCRVKCLRPRKYAPNNQIHLLTWDQGQAFFCARTN